MRRNRADRSSRKFCRDGNFIDKNGVKFWLVSSFASAAAKLHYELSLEIQKYRLQCGRIYEIMGKFWADVAYGVWGAAAFLGICVLKLWEAAPSRLWMHTHRGYVFICPATGGGYITFLVLLKQKIDTFRLVQNRQNSIKIHLKSLKIDKNSF